MHWSPYIISKRLWTFKSTLRNVNNISLHHHRLYLNDIECSNSKPFILERVKRFDKKVKPSNDFTRNFDALYFIRHKTVCFDIIQKKCINTAGLCVQTNEWKFKMAELLAILELITLIRRGAQAWGLFFPIYMEMRPKMSCRR